MSTSDDVSKAPPAGFERICVEEAHAPPELLDACKRALEAATWGFAVETGLHALRLIMGGIFDRFDKLKPSEYVHSHIFNLNQTTAR